MQTSTRSACSCIPKSEIHSLLKMSRKSILWVPFFRYATLSAADALNSVRDFFSARSSVIFATSPANVESTLQAAWCKVSTQMRASSFSVVSKRIPVRVHVQYFSASEHLISLLRKLHNKLWFVTFGPLKPGGPMKLKLLRTTSNRSCAPDFSAFFELQFMILISFQNFQNVVNF